MIPVTYHSMLSSANSGHPNPLLDRVLNSSNVKCCQKCGFSSTDAAELKKHVMEHKGTRFYCFYCNKVSFSEAELNAHLKEHNSKYPFNCPHCGQGYMRRLCLVNHIERVHSKVMSQGPAKTGMITNPHVPASSALSSVSTADPSLLRPTVRVKVPALSSSVARLAKDEQIDKTLDTNVSHATNGSAELLSPLNGLFQHSRALTVSLPEEITIPNGCMVELVEVKTVNGTKELKLRIVSQQGNESVIKDTRTTVSQNAALGQPFLSALNHTNTVKSMNMGMCTINRKQCETKSVNLERPAIVPVHFSKNLPNQVSQGKVGLKRTLPEIINLEYHEVVPKKVPNILVNPVREGNCGIRVAQRDLGNHANLHSVISNRAVNRSTGALHRENKGAHVSQRAVDDRRNLIDHSKGVLPLKESDVRVIPSDVSRHVKLEPGEIREEDYTNLKTKKGAVGFNQQKSASPSLNVLSAGQVRPPAILVCKDNVANSSFSIPRTPIDSPSGKTPALCNRTNSKVSSWVQEVRSNERLAEGDLPESEGFPVISSVFSLSQQSEDGQGSFQPLVMALRGLVMDKSNSSVCTILNNINTTNSTEQVMEAEKSKLFSRMSTIDGSIIRHLLMTDRKIDTIKVEGQDKGIQHPPSLTHNNFLVKEEQNNNTLTDKSKCNHTPESKSCVKDEKSKVDAQVNAHATTTPPQEVAQSEHDMSKFLTVSLKRVQVGVWKKNKKGLKPRISKYRTPVPGSSLTDSTVIYPMPLKGDQLVKRPGPNQPVVVLNHPKPRTNRQGARTDRLETGASEGAPKCNILKMRLSKVMGQKYEVMGCTVGVFQ